MRRAPVGVERNLLGCRRGKGTSGMCLRNLAPSTTGARGRPLPARGRGEGEGMRIRLSVVLSAAVLLLGAGSAGASTIYDLTSDHCTNMFPGGCGTAPFGTVTLTQNGGNVDITVHLNSPNFF